MTDETHELLTMSREALGVWFDKYPAGFTSTLAALRDAIVAACRADLTTAKREAASRAWDAADTTFDPNASRSESRDRYLDREHPLPARECVLSDGTRISHDPRNGAGTIKVTHASGECSAWFTPEEFAIVRRCYMSDDLMLASRFAAGVGR